VTPPTRTPPPIPTPALDALAAEARSQLAEHWDAITAGRDPRQFDTWWGAARAAAMSARRIGPPDPASNAATDAQIEPAGRVMSAYAEIRALARSNAPDASLASVVVTKVEHEGPTVVALADGAVPGTVESVEASVLTRICTDVAGFLAARRGGIGAAARDLAGGADGFEREAWS